MAAAWSWYDTTCFLQPLVWLLVWWTQLHSWFSDIIHALVHFLPWLKWPTGFMIPTHFSLHITTSTLLVWYEWPMSQKCITYFKLAWSPRSALITIDPSRMTRTFLTYTINISLPRPCFNKRIFLDMGIIKIRFTFGNPYACKTTSLYWSSPRMICLMMTSHECHRVSNWWSFNCLFKVIHKDVKSFLNETVKKICFHVDL